MTKNFALIGVAGYVVPRHLKAIKDTGNVLVAALDKCDSVGILDSYFPEASFFTEYERFDRFVDKYRREKNKRIDYVSICSPNYLHDSHIRFALRNGADAICEKPLVLNPHNLDQLKVLEKETGKKVHTILQLRLHESIIALKKKITGELSKNPDKVYDISLTYLTSRGRWYFVSWKGDEAKSGGIATNIGIHFFDMLSWIFGPIEENVVHIKQPDTNAGFMKLKNARVRWLLSVNYNYLPEETKAEGKRTFRSILVDGEEIEFSEGFTDLHTASYRDILEGRGFGMDDARNSIVIVSDIFFTREEFLRLLHESVIRCSTVRNLHGEELRQYAPAGPKQEVRLGRLIIEGVPKEEFEKLSALQFLFVGTRCPTEEEAAGAELHEGRAEGLVSIVIPVFNNLYYTRKCLEAVKRNSPAGRYEIIVVDNASTDGTSEFLSSPGLKAVTVITNAENLRFTLACNQGARAARGEYVLFLNNDTEPQPGWLESIEEK